MEETIGTKRGSDMMDHEFRDSVVSSLAELSTQMRTLVGNGQPGLIKEIQIKHDTLAAKVNRLLILTAILAFGGAASAWPRIAPILQFLLK